MKKKYIIDEPIFKTSTLFLCGYSHLEMEKEVKQRGVKEFDASQFATADGTVLFFTEEETKTPFRLVWIKPTKKDAYTIGVASHELLHLVLRICEWKNIPITTRECADETPAYLLEFYMKKFIDNIF